MGQYFKPVCVDTMEFLLAHTFNEGLKLVEFSSGTMMLSAIAALLAIPSEDERGAWTGISTRHGAWAGTRLVVTGDYAPEGQFVPTKDESCEGDEEEKLNLYGYVSNYGKDISGDVMKGVGELAGQHHPVAVLARMPKSFERYWYNAPDGMEEYLDLTKAAELAFSSFKQLHEFAWREVELGSTEEQGYRFSDVLRLISLKFNREEDREVSGVEVKVSEDDMRVESVRFVHNDEELVWSFPLAVTTVYETLGILPRS